MNERTPTDGKPYYCSLCGCGFGEYLACEMPDCKLESERKAKLRQKKATAPSQETKEKDQRYGSQEGR